MPSPINLIPGEPAIPPLGIGTWSWGDRVFWGFGSTYTRSDLRAVFESSINAGIVLFDTAEVYGMGRSERFLGEFIRTATRQVIIATKYFPFPRRLKREQAVLAALHGSLRRLGLDQVDLYQVHWPSPFLSPEEAGRALAAAVEEGLTKAVGVSNYDTEQMLRTYEVLDRRGIALASNQVEYSLTHRQPEKSGLLDRCKELGVTLIAYSPIAQGILSGRYTAENPPPGRRKQKFSADFLTRLQPLLTTLKEIGEKHGGKSPAQVALNWTIAKGTLPIPGAKTASQADDNIEAVRWLLEESDVARLDEASLYL
nr:aldo/keto reductase [Anaerolineae bacterium]